MGIAGKSWNTVRSVALNGLIAPGILGGVMVGSAYTGISLADGVDTLWYKAHLPSILPEKWTDYFEAHRDYLAGHHTIEEIIASGGVFLNVGLPIAGLLFRLIYAIPRAESDYD